MEVEVRSSDGNVEIIPPKAEGRLVRKSGLLVWQPAPGTPPISAEEIERAIQDVREEREERILRGVLGEDRS